MNAHRILGARPSVPGFPMQAPRNLARPSIHSPVSHGIFPASSSLGHLNRVRRSESGQAEEYGCGFLVASGVVFGAVAWASHKYLGEGTKSFISNNLHWLMASATVFLCWLVTAGLARIYYVKEGMQGALAAKDHEVSQLKGGLLQCEKDLAASRALTAAEQGLKKLYISAVLGMKEGDRRSALKLITSQTMMAESADNLAALLSQFPDDTATLIIGLTASTKDSALVKKIGEAINLMEPSVQKEIAVKSYMRTKGSEALIASLWAGNARVGIAEILKAISEAIDPQTGRDIILSAARSRSEHMRLAVVRSTSESDEALLVPLMSDPSINVSKAAAQKLIKQETPAAKLTEFLRSAQPGVRAAVVEHKNATRPLVISAFGDTDPTVRTLAFTRMGALLTADETELAASAAKDDEILWRVAEHNTSTCAALATCFNKLLRNTAKIVDQPEEGHNEDYNDGYSSGSNWVVDKQEVSHNEVPAQDMQRAIALCTARGITLEQITKGLSRDISGQFTRDFMPVLIKSVIDRFNALKPGQQLEPALSDFVAYVCSLPPENAAKLVSELEPAKAAAVLKKMPAEKATALSVHFTQVFLVNLFLFGQR